MIISVYYRTLDFRLLSGHKLRCGHAVRTEILGMVFVQEEINNMLLRER